MCVPQMQGPCQCQRHIKVHISGRMFAHHLPLLPKRLCEEQLCKGEGRTEMSRKVWAAHSLYPN